MSVTPGLIKFRIGHKISLDTNVFICALNKKDSRQEKSLAILEQIKKKGISVSISVLVLEEFFIRIYKQKEEQDIPALLDFITMESIVAVLDVNQELALQAAKLRAEYTSLRTPDAIHLASAINAGAKVFITTDKRLPKKVGKLKVEVLS